MSKPSDPVIGREIWPLFDYCDKYIEGKLDKAGGEGLTPQEAVDLLPHMNRTVELIDRALVEPNTSGYPRQELITMKTTLITMLNGFKEQL